MAINGMALAIAAVLFATIIAMCHGHGLRRGFAPDDIEDVVRSMTPMAQLVRHVHANEQLERGAASMGP